MSSTRKCTSPQWRISNCPCSDGPGGRGRRGAGPVPWPVTPVRGTTPGRSVDGRRSQLLVLSLPFGTALWGPSCPPNRRRLAPLTAVGYPATAAGCPPTAGTLQPPSATLQPPCETLQPPSVTFNCRRLPYARASSASGGPGVPQRRKPRNNVCVGACGGLHRGPPQRAAGFADRLPFVVCFGRWPQQPNPPPPSPPPGHRPTAVALPIGSTPRAPFSHSAPPGGMGLGLGGHQPPTPAWTPQR